MTETAPTDFDEAVARAQANATEEAPPQAEFLPEADDVDEGPRIELFVQVEGEVVDGPSETTATDSDVLTSDDFSAVILDAPVDTVEAHDEEIDTLISNLRELEDDDVESLLTHIGEVEAALMLTWEHEDRWQQKFCKLCNLSASRDGAIPHEPNCIIPKLMEPDEEAE